MGHCTHIISDVPFLYAPSTQINKHREIFFFPSTPARDLITSRSENPPPGHVSHSSPDPPGSLETTTALWEKRSPQEKKQNITVQKTRIIK
jgi:hypothetical protein